MTKLSRLIASLLLMSGIPAHAELVSAKDQKKIVTLLQERGYKAEFIEGKEVNYIRSSDSGVPITLYFMNCASGRQGCTTIQLYTGFSDVNATLEQINAWNKSRRFARAYIDNEGDPVIEMDVDMDFDGIDRRNFNANLDIFLASIPKFREHLTKK